MALARVIAGSRLHAGFYYAGPGRPYSWGSAAFYSTLPRTVVEAEACRRGLSVEGQRAGEVREALESLGLEGVCVRVKEVPSRHYGLGSTTQLLLAAACAALAALGSGHCSPREVSLLARRLGRGRVSGAGTLAFAYGGFVADAGAPDPMGPRPVIRLRVPDKWRFIVVVPRLARGLSEAEEGHVLSTPWTPDPEPERLMARGLLRLAAGIAREDLLEALEGLREIQLGTGMYFSRIQGGAYRSDLQAITGEAHRNGIILAQSSWGPTLYTITTNEDAWGDAALLRSILADLGLEGEVIVGEPLNGGARILVG